MISRDPVSWKVRVSSGVTWNLEIFYPSSVVGHRVRSQENSTRVLKELRIQQGRRDIKETHTTAAGQVGARAGWPSLTNREEK